MFKRSNFPYLIFFSFILFILYSFYFIINSKKHTQNNYSTLEKIEQLNIVNRKIDNVLSKKLQYIDANKIFLERNRFEKTFSNLRWIVSHHKADKDFSNYLINIQENFVKKEKLLNQFIIHNHFLNASLEKLLKLQGILQKRYYFSPLGREVNNTMVVFMQTALGKNENLQEIKQNIKKVESSRKLYKLVDPQLKEFIDNSYLTIAHINNLSIVRISKENINLGVSIDDLEIALVKFFEKEADKEEVFSYTLIFLIICFVITLIVTHEIDKNHRKKLEEQTSKLNEAQACAHLGSWEINMLTREIYFSEEMYKISEFDEKRKIENKDIMALVHPDDRDKILHMLKKTQDEKTDGSAIHKIVTRHHNLKYVENIWHNQYDERGNLIKTFGVLLDITNAKKLEEENKKKEEIMYQQSKMVAMGEMIGNIAHQWRQPLSIISTSATGAKLEKDYGLLTDEKFEETMDQINDNAQYLSQTIDDFRNFIKGDKEVIIFELQDSINSFLHLVHPSVRNHHINTIVDLDDKIEMRGRPSELMQCFINIFSNAKDAFKERNISDNRMMFVSAKKQKDKVIVTFKDNAGGIPQNVIDRIFEPYFTTKHQSQGTGIGLHMTYNIILAMKGKIEVSNKTYTYEDKEYTGAEFIITLPL